MTVEVLRTVTLVVFSSLALACIGHWLRRRSASDRWAAVAFGSLAAIGIIGRLVESDPTELATAWLLKLLIVAVILFPWFLFRFAATFGRPPERTSRMLHAITSVAVLATLSLPNLPPEGAARPLWLQGYSLLILFQWTFLFGFVGRRLWWAGQGQATVVRLRVRTLALGAAGMNASILLGSITPMAPSEAIVLANQVLSLVSALLFFVGLVPPSPIVTRWRRPEELAFRDAMAGFMGATSTAELSAVLLPKAVRLIGGTGGMLLDPQGNVLASHGSVGDDGPGRGQGVQRVQLRSGSLLLWTSPYAPYFGRGELYLVESVAAFADLALERCVLWDRQQEVEARLAHQATHDALTGLPNRASLMDHLDAALREATVDEPVAVIFLDIDRFKVVNDGLDHTTGDTVLRGVARRLRQAVGGEALVARFGGDEFVVVAPRHADVNALSLAYELVEAVSHPTTVRGRVLTVTASAGVVVATGGSADELIRDADAAMYRAKAIGRSHVVLFDRVMQDDAAQRLDLEGELASAVGFDQLRLEYQPEVDLATGALVGLEALVRWDHPRLGRLMPKDFIAIAEESGSIASVGVWVIEEACRQAARWQETMPALGPIPIWVNVSPSQFALMDVATTIQRSIEANGLAPGRIGLEVTESVFLDPSDDLRDALLSLRDKGVRIAIDDFGTGYASLGALKRFPADMVKIDGSFVSGLTPGSDDAAIVAACVALSSALRLTTIAEAIETPSQWRQLVDLGVSHGQGFLFARPLTPTDVEAYVLGERRLGAACRGAVVEPVT